MCPCNCQLWISLPRAWASALLKQCEIIVTENCTKSQPKSIEGLWMSFKKQGELFLNSDTQYWFSSFLFLPYIQYSHVCLHISVSHIFFLCYNKILEVAQDWCSSPVLLDPLKQIHSYIHSHTAHACNAVDKVSFYCSHLPPSFRVPSPLRLNCWRSMFSTWPNTTRTTTFATGHASFASSSCPPRRVEP